MRKTPEQAVLDVIDEESFVRFVMLLAIDRDEHDAREAGDHKAKPSLDRWRNKTVHAYLDAAAAWGISTARAPNNAENPWHRCADIVLAGKAYQ